MRIDVDPPDPPDNQRWWDIALGGTLVILGVALGAFIVIVLERVVL